MKPKILLLSLVILIAFFLSKCAEKAIVPDELLGVWKTTDPKYPDPCFFELTEERIIFGTIEGTVESCLIKRISKKKVEAETRILYTICYLDSEELEYELPVYYYPLEKGIVRFKNQQDIVWTKEKREK